MAPRERNINAGRCASGCACARVRSRSRGTAVGGSVGVKRGSRAVGSGASLRGRSGRGHRPARVSLLSERWRKGPRRPGETVCAPRREPQSRWGLVTADGRGGPRTSDRDGPWATGPAAGKRIGPGLCPRLCKTQGKTVHGAWACSTQLEMRHEVTDTASEAACDGVCVCISATSRDCGCARWGLAREDVGEVLIEFVCEKVPERPARAVNQGLGGSNS